MPLEIKKIRKAIAYSVFFTFITGIGFVIWGAATGHTAQVSLIASLIFALSAVELGIYLVFIIASGIFKLFKRGKRASDEKPD